MFHTIRAVHRWIGIVCSLLLIVLACTGFLLALKKRFDWIQPTAQEGQSLASMHEVVPIGQVAEAVFAVGIPELQTHEDFYRFELHVSKNLFKVMSKEGYHEVQVDARTGKVLSVGRRNDNLIESIHDLSFFGDPPHDWGLPLVALGLFSLGASGIYMFSVPLVRRWRFRKQQARAAGRKPEV